jgi:hypothetical protein
MKTQRVYEVLENKPSGSPWYIPRNTRWAYIKKPEFVIVKQNAKIFDTSTYDFYKSFQEKISQYPDHPLLQEPPLQTKQQQIGNTLLQGFNKYNTPTYEDQLYILLKDFYGMDYDGFVFEHFVTNEKRVALFHTNVLDPYTSAYSPFEESMNNIPIVGAMRMIDGKIYAHKSGLTDEEIVKQFDPL